MTIESFLTRLTSTNAATSLTGALPQSFAVAKAGPYPLVRHAALPGSSTGGEVLLELDGLSWGPVHVTALEPDPANDELTLTLAPAALTGTYALFGLEKPDVELDTGGWMEPLAAFAAPPGTPGASGQITPQQFDQLMQANAQRDQLNQTPNGRLMLSNYDAHNDDYNHVFQTNASLRTKWSEGGATQEMMDHTSQALDSGDVINPDPAQKTFGTQNIGYNANALKQQLAVWGACFGANLIDAANATATFSGSVTTNTTNTAQTTNAMTGPQVYQVVATGNPPANVAPAAAVAGTPTVTAQAAPAAGTPPVGGTTPAGGVVTAAAPHPLHLALSRFVEDAHGPEDMALLAEHGADEENLAMVRQVYAAAQRVNAPANRVALQSGEASAQSGVARYRYRLTQQPDGAVTLRLIQSSLALGDLDIGAAAWPSEVGTAVGDSARGAAFVRGILEDRIASGLTRTLRRLAGAA